MAAASLSVGATPLARAALSNAELRLGFISCGGRGGELMSAFEKLPGVAIAGLCDPDAARLGKAAERFPKAKTAADMRTLIEDPDIDAVVIAAPNHWHCLASIWAMAAGKDVYVEKPLSHSQWEGEQVVAAARKYSRICQVGTQQRSDPMQAEIRKFLHEEKAIGAITAARVNRFGVRGPIGRRSSPLVVDKSVNYDLWLGPAADRPIFRDNLQYDWHWDWNTGSGEMGNWGVHVVDDVRNIVLQDAGPLPKRILAGGGRIEWDDAGETPNVHFAYFDAVVPVVMALTNLPESPGGRKSPKCPGPGSGYIAYCEGGRLEGQRGSAVAYDKEGKELRRFKGDSGMGHHQQNFIDAVRARDQWLLNADVETGHHSTGWCNLANIAFRAGGRMDHQSIMSIQSPEWHTMMQELHNHAATYSIGPDSGDIQASVLLELDPAAGRFTGQNSEIANGFLRREYRKGYEILEIA
jgi:predicted dehydrogenase